jgi:hypothetical protein
MITQNLVHRLTSKRYSLDFYFYAIAINNHIRQTVETFLTKDESVLIDTLRGLNGRRAKLSLFRKLIASGNYTYSQLVEAFPNYDH